MFRSRSIRPACTPPSGRPRAEASRARSTVASPACATMASSLSPCRTEAVAGAAQALGAFDPGDKPLWGLPVRRQGQHRRRGPADHRRLPGLRLSRRAPPRRRWSACSRPARCPIGKTNLDQFATGLVGVRTPYPRAAQSVRPRHGAGRLELRLGGRRGARAGQLRARHRHGGLRPGAGRPEQYGRPEADARRRLRRAASCPPAARSIASRSSPPPWTTLARPMR